MGPERQQSGTDGSSPRVWGTRRRLPQGKPYPSVHPHVCGELLEARAPIQAPRRFIPTCVGNPRYVRQPPKGCSVHPHVCGEHLSLAVRKVTPLRFIPTCVGNSTVWLRCKCCPAVHPHVCGELFFRRFTIKCLLRGSSPRVWGITGCAIYDIQKYRFIPTCVGNTFRACSTKPCGLGSSPRVWGILCNVQR